MIIDISMLSPTNSMFEVYARALNSRSESTLLSLTLILLLTLAVMVTLESVRPRVLLCVSSAFDRKLSGGVFDRIYASEIRLLGQHRSRPLSDLTTFASS